MLHETSFHPYAKRIFPADFPKGNENIGLSFCVITFDKECVYIIESTDILLEILSE